MWECPNGNWLLAAVHRTEQRQDCVCGGSRESPGKVKAREHSGLHQGGVRLRKRSGWLQNWGEALQMSLASSLGERESCFTWDGRVKESHPGTFHPDFPEHVGNGKRDEIGPAGMLVCGGQENTSETVQRTHSPFLTATSLARCG